MSPNRGKSVEPPILPLTDHPLSLSLHQHPPQPRSYFYRFFSGLLFCLLVIVTVCLVLRLFFPPPRSPTNHEITIIEATPSYLLGYPKIYPYDQEEHPRRWFAPEEQQEFSPGEQQQFYYDEQQPSDPSEENLEDIDPQVFHKLLEQNAEDEKNTAAVESLNQEEFESSGRVLMKILQTTEDIIENKTEVVNYGIHLSTTTQANRLTTIAKENNEPAFPNEEIEESEMEASPAANEATEKELRVKKFLTKLGAFRNMF